MLDPRFSLTKNDHIILNLFPNSKDQLRAIADAADETLIEAGRYGQHCTFTQEILDKLAAEFAEILEYCREKFADWASD